MAHLLAFADHLADYALPIGMVVLALCALVCFVYLVRTAPWNR